MQICKPGDWHRVCFFVIIHACLKNIAAKLNNQLPSSYSGLTRVSPIAFEKQDTRVKPEYDDTVIVSYLAIRFLSLKICSIIIAAVL